MSNIYNKGADVEVLVSDVLRERLFYEKDKVLMPIFNQSKSAVIRATLADGRFGSVTTTDVDSGVNKALSIARSSSPVLRNAVNKSIHFPEVELGDDFDEFDLSFFKDNISEAVSVFKANDLSVQSIMVDKTHLAELFYNSEGVSVNESSSRFFVLFSLVTKNGQPISEGRFFSSRPDFLSMVDEVLWQAKLLSNLEKPVSAEQDVILGYDFLNDFFSSVFAYAVDGFNAYKKSTLFKLGSVVGSKGLNVINDPLIKRGLHSYSFDSEGSPAVSTPIVSKGLLRSFLNDNYSAALNGSASTSSCSSLLGKPSVAPSNLVIVPPSVKKSFDDLVREVKNGVFVKDVSGTHLVNPTSGDFGNNIYHGFVIRDGEFVGAIKNAMITGNFYDLLKRDWIMSSDAVQRDLLVAPPVLTKARIVA